MLGILWQSSFANNSPKQLFFEGQTDIFFTCQWRGLSEDLPHAEMHRFDAGHFAVEDHLDYIF